jgi:hypothetical protein
MIFLRHELTKLRRNTFAQLDLFKPLTMLEIDTWLTVIGVILPFFTLSLLILPIRFALTDRAKKKLHLVILLGLMWSLFQSVLALNMWYVDRNQSWPHFLFPWLLFTALLSILTLTPRGKRLFNALSSKHWNCIQLGRWVWVMILPSLVASHQLGPLAWSESAYLSLITALISTILIVAYSKLSVLQYRIGHGLVLVLTTIEIVLHVLALPTPFQQWSFESPNFVMGHFPFVLMNALMYPIWITSSMHGILVSKNN